jgi:hypothetical protein
LRVRLSVPLANRRKCQAVKLHLQLNEHIKSPSVGGAGTYEGLGIEERALDSWVLF